MFVSLLSDHLIEIVANSNYRTPGFEAYMFCIVTKAKVGYDLRNI